ncbi:MAG: hypothetical protein ACYC6L_10060, partial [Anaerolineae bacterium]
MSKVWKNVTLEMSPKPFKTMTPEDIRTVAEEIFRQWDALTRHADMISVLLFTADGSEILDYRGKLEDKVDWAQYLGCAGVTREKPPEVGRRGVSLHGRAVVFTDNPPVMTYGTLKDIVTILKEVGHRMTGLPIRVGAMFDPGPEFAQAPFKYKRHPEICLADTMSDGSFVCCYTTLNADNEQYAGFPNGIPQDTPFGTFLGKQCQHFLSDLGFDYIWFSNGFGFGYETWHTVGALFDGKRFDAALAPQVRQKIIDFWRYFRAECPDYPIETRGTNLGTGIDLASDGVPLKDIYEGGFKMFPPPNSPWAAIDGDFGLELAGYMSHIAQVPGDSGFPFRFYLHDPWWINSPWFDRYGREPHDLYLPLSIARVTAQGNMDIASNLDFLTIDNSFGEMPVQGPNEVTAHILAARLTPPDQPGPLVWIYPFKQNHELTFGDKPNLARVFYGDWVVRGAINTGLPLNTVVSSENFISAWCAKPHLFDGSVLFSPVPDADSELENVLLDFVSSGGSVLLYGPTVHASDKLLALLGIRFTPSISGEVVVQFALSPDTFQRGSWPRTMLHRELMNSGGLNAVPDGSYNPSHRILATVEQGDEQRVVSVINREPAWEGGCLAWVRATNCSNYVEHRALLVPDDPTKLFLGERLLRWALDEMGYAIRYRKPNTATRDPLITISRHKNGYFFSGYMPDTTATLQLKFPQGAPLLLGYETEIVDGYSQYRMPRGWQRECRVFIKQQSGVVSCTEQCSVEVGIRRRMWLRGLDAATVRFYLEPGSDVVVQRIWAHDEAHDAYPFSSGKDRSGPYILVEDVTGE